MDDGFLALFLAPYALSKIPCFLRGDLRLRQMNRMIAHFNNLRMYRRKVRLIWKRLRMQ